MKKYSVIGNNLKVEMKYNVNRMKIVGDNNVVLVERNEGTIVMVGQKLK